MHATTFHAAIEINATPAQLEALTSALVSFDVTLCPCPGGRTEVTLHLPAEDLRQATTLALALVEQAGTTAVTLEVMTADEARARAGAAVIPPLVSVTEAADMLGITRQGVLKMITSGRIVAARQAGNIWVMPLASVEALL